MLGMEVYDVSDTMYVRVEGRLAGAYAENMRAMVVRSTLPSRLLVDISKVTVVDDTGEEVLLWLWRIGAQFIADSCYSLDACDRLHLPLQKTTRVRTAGSLCCSPA